jgi:hypothetical protein
MHSIIIVVRQDNSGDKCPWYHGQFWDTLPLPLKDKTDQVSWKIEIVCKFFFHIYFVRKKVCEIGTIN